MKAFSSIIFLFFSSIAISQVINIDEIVFSPSENVTVVFVDGQSINEGPSGQNQTWDFSNVLGMDTIVWRGEDPSENELGQMLFPDAELAIRIPTPGNDTIDFEYYEFDSFEDDQIITLGSYSILTNRNTGNRDTTITDNTSNPREDFQFPIEFGDEFTSDFNSVITTQVLDSVYTSRRGGSIEMTADATGTIKTPVDTYENVVRVERIEKQIDTVFIEVLGMQFETYRETEIVYYDWMQPNRNFSVYRVIITKSKFPGLPDQIGVSAFYTFNVSSSIDEQKIADELKPLVYPNPLSDIVNLEFAPSLKVNQIQICNQTGQVIKTMNGEINEVSFAECAPGIYFLVIQTDQGKFTQKLSKL
jgi:hypothetical protein